MLKKSRLISASMSLVLAVSLISGVNTITVSADTTSYADSYDSGLTLNNMPSNLKSSIEWVWNNRILKEKSAERRNIIFDQIFAGDGTINYVVRWQSNKSVTLQQRKGIEKMLDRQINNWAKYLKGYDEWPYDEIKVKVVGWACADPSLILDKQDDEIVYTDTIVDDLSKSNSSIPSQLPTAPSSLSRADHFYDSSYSYPGGLDKRFDMYLWGTTNFQGGAGGDWGQRMSDDYILSAIDLDEAHIIEHEMGHGFGLPDFYEDNDRPPGGFPTNTIMWAGNSMSITDWDIWMLRYTWSQIKNEDGRFTKKNVDNGSSNAGSDYTEESNIASKAAVTSSFCSDWENINALNDGYTPANSNDRNHDVYGNWPSTGKQWVKYTFDKEYTITKSDIYWFKDNQGIDVPASYKIKYWDGSQWRSVSNASGLGTDTDKFNSTSFDAVTTNSIMIEMDSNGSYSTGILEWQVFGK